MFNRDIKDSKEKWHTKEEHQKLIIQFFECFEYQGQSFNESESSDTDYHLENFQSCQVFFQS